MPISLLAAITVTYRSELRNNTSDKMADFVILQILEIKYKSVPLKKHAHAKSVVKNSVPILVQNECYFVYLPVNLIWFETIKKALKH